MPQTLIHVGTSRALTVPAKVLREYGVSDDTLFEFIPTAKGFSFEIIRRDDCPKVSKKEMSARMTQLLNGPSLYTQEEIDSDERLRYIVGK